MAVQQYPHDACPTLYAEGFPEDITKRELAHIFRPYEGYKVRCTRWARRAGAAGRRQGRAGLQGCYWA